MDHAIEALQRFIDATFEYVFSTQWQSGDYKKYSDCPSYEELKTLIDASNIMRKYAGWQTLTIKKMLEN